MRSVLKLLNIFLGKGKNLSSCKAQVTETGWGEFEIQIKIYLADPVERPVTIYHVLKLFQVSKKVNTPLQFLTDKEIAFFVLTDRDRAFHRPKRAEGGEVGCLGVL